MNGKIIIQINCVGKLLNEIIRKESAHFLLNGALEIQGLYTQGP